MGIVERIGSLAGSDTAHAVNFAHETFHQRMGSHGHFGRALIETVAEVCRQHPAIVGIVAGVLVEQLLVQEKHHHERVVAAEAAAGTAAPAAVAAPTAQAAPAASLPRAAPPHTPHHLIRLSAIRPFRIAVEVFGALLLLKLGDGLAKTFRRNHADPWFEPAAKIHLLSGSLAAYYVAKILKAPKVSAWRNAAAALFATDAIKPLLKPRRA